MNFYYKNLLQLIFVMCFIFNLFKFKLPLIMSIDCHALVSRFLTVKTSSLTYTRTMWYQLLYARTNMSLLLFSVLPIFFAIFIYTDNLGIKKRKLITYTGFVYGFLIFNFEGKLQRTVFETA